jgi:hypothetical protein
MERGSADLSSGRDPETGSSRGPDIGRDMTSGDFPDTVWSRAAAEAPSDPNDLSEPSGQSDYDALFAHDASPGNESWDEPDTPFPHDPAAEGSANEEEQGPLRVGGDEDASRDRRRTRLAVLISIAALAVLVAVAVPVIVYLTKPSPGHVHAPAQVAGLSLDSQSDAADTAEYLRSAIAAGMSLQSSVGAVYTDGTGAAHSVIFVGGTTNKGTTTAKLTTLLGMLDDGTDGIANLTAEPAGPLGGEVKCATTTDSSVSDAAHPEPMAACGWADASTVGLALFPNRSMTDSVRLFGQMRAAVEDRH